MIYNNKNLIFKKVKTGKVIFDLFYGIYFRVKIFFYSY
ncbi:hypothetical protein LEP1GSC059_4272 [Leptospira noguchii serovar Panama str. CZ214]|uniref:Uncharacterized protein n=1 Tax=Leptospira noguchii serovar Panama str. CZ214 TaxID=1001595 RepID=T0FG17_9LEPT|nr:hypothetical protein LEP1GSC059_4272 [Leptospira noguchii serovar Panama str. CZ214]